MGGILIKCWCAGSRWPGGGAVTTPCFHAEQGEGLDSRGYNHYYNVIICWVAVTDWND